MKRIVVVALLCAASAAAASIPYERPVTAPVYGPAPGGRGVAAAASDGTGFLVAWNDGQRGALYASRVGADGTVLDATGIRIEPATPFASAQPFVFWGGDAYVIFWMELDGLHAARVDNNGTVIDDAHPVLAASVSRMASNGSRIVATYGSRLAVLDMSGGLIERDLELPAAVGTIASNGTGFLASWVAGGDAYGIVLDRFGRPFGPAQLMILNASGVAASASNGTSYLVIVHNALTGRPSAVNVSASGQPLDVDDFQGEDNSAALAWNGSHYIYTWNDGNGIHALRLDARGLAVDPQPALLTSEAALHAVATAGAKVLVVWRLLASSIVNIKAEVVTEAGTLVHTAPTIVSLSAAEQLTPRIAFSGRNYLVVWQERGGIWAARVGLDGRSLDVNGISVAAAGSAPNVVFDGAAFVVSWLSSFDLWMMRIDPDSGAALDGGGISVMHTVCAYDIAANGDVTMLAFAGCGTRTPAKAMRFNRALQPLDVPLAIMPAEMAASAPSIAWSGTQWLIAFEEVIYYPIFFEVPPDAVSRGNIRAVRLSASMALLDTQPIVVASSDDDQVPHRVPHAAASGDDYVITWTRGFYYSGPRDVIARHLLPNGTLGGEIPIGRGLSTSTIWTGSRYAIGFTTAANDAVGLTLGKFGDTTPGALFKISATSDAEGSAALIAANGGITGAYARQATEPLYGGVWRVFVRDGRPMHGRVAAH